MKNIYEAIDEFREMPNVASVECDNKRNITIVRSDGDRFTFTYEGDRTLVFCDEEGGCPGHRLRTDVSVLAYVMSLN